MKLYGPNSFFETKEFTCPCGCGFGSQVHDTSERLIDWLNEIRILVNRPILITSGARCKTYNEQIGGAPNSAHLPNPETHQCEAADLKVQGGIERLEIIKLALYIGFRRIGCAKDFVHLDVAKHLPNEVLWTY